MYGRKKASGIRGTKRYRTSFKKGSRTSSGRKKFAIRAPYNDDPKTPFRSWPLSTNRNEFFCKVTGQFAVVLVGGGDAGWSIPINFPSYIVFPSNTIGQATLIPNNYDNLIALFDDYFVQSVQVKFTPTRNVHEATNLSAVTKTVAYSNRDLVDPVVITNEGAALNGAGLIQHNIYQPWYRYAKPQINQWLPVVVFPVFGTTNFNQITQSFPPGVQESIKLFFPGIVVGTTPFGYVNVTWNVRFRGLSSETS